MAGRHAETVYRVYAHMMPGADERCCEATARFLAKLRSCALRVPGEVVE